MFNSEHSRINLLQNVSILALNLVMDVKCLLLFFQRNHETIVHIIIKISILNVVFPFHYQKCQEKLFFLLEEALLKRSNPSYIFEPIASKKCIITVTFTMPSNKIPLKNSPKIELSL